MSEDTKGRLLAAWFAVLILSLVAISYRAEMGEWPW